MPLRILCLLMVSILAFGQATVSEVDELEFFAISYEVTLSAATGAFSLQAPANSGRRIYLKSATVYCSVACTINQDRNGTAATTTLLTPSVRINGSTSTAVAKAYAPSNAGTGDTLLTLALAAGEKLSLDMSYSAFGRGSSAAQNHNFRVNAITGIFRVSAIWAEKP